jgi:pyruvate/2-oxoglutarate dehydrogenase complex dihydrolipoamide acyltransferase (E2) component
VAAATLAAAAAWLFVRARPLGVTAGGQAMRDGDWVAAPAGATVPIRFSEGTEVVLAPEAHARIAEISPRGAHVLLESGQVHVAVTPGRGGRWTFTAGPFRVDVKGTRFDLAWSPAEQRLRLQLVEGSVTVSGCALGEARPLFAGETLSTSCLTNELHIDGAATSASAAPPSTAGVPPPTLPTPTPAPSAEPIAAPPASGTARMNASHPGAGAGPTWQALARSSHFKEAFDRVTERGFDEEMARVGRDDLLLLGDVARLSGDPGRALAAYERVRARAPGSEAAANAAFSMGRVYFDEREAYRDAARWFGTYRAERAGGPFARDAMGRQMEALWRAGDRAGAASLAGEYLGAYPNGPHADLARTLRDGAHGTGGVP